MTDDMSLELTLFVEHGREQEAADFYRSAFGATQVGTHGFDNAVTAVELRLGTMPLTVTGSNPKREQDPSLGGPFFPKASGAVSAIMRLTVGDLEGIVQKAVRAGATLRDPIQPDHSGRRVASLFDPFGHIWALLERPAEDARKAA